MRGRNHVGGKEEENFDKTSFACGAFELFEIIDVSFPSFSCFETKFSPAIAKEKMRERERDLEFSTKHGSCHFV